MRVGPARPFAGPGVGGGEERRGAHLTAGAVRPLRPLRRRGGPAECRIETGQRRATGRRPVLVYVCGRRPFLAYWAGAALDVCPT